jgi:hypothetical protein
MKKNRIGQFILILSLAILVLLTVGCQSPESQPTSNGGIAETQGVPGDNNTNNESEAGSGNSSSKEITTVALSVMHQSIGNRPLMIFPRPVWSANLNWKHHRRTFQKMNGSMFPVWFVMKRTKKESSSLNIPG